MKKALSILLAFTILISFIPSAAAVDQEFLTREELMNLLITAADDYHTAQPGDIIKGDENGQLRYTEKVTRIEALVMLWRAFGEFPALSSNRLYADLADTDVSFSDIPAWARQDIDSLIAAGLLANTEDGLLHTTDTVTKDEVQLLLRRVWMLFGSNEKDDFYAASQKENINQTKRHPGYSGMGSAHDVIHQRDERIDTILAAILSSQWADSSDQQKIKDYYEAALSVCSGESSDLGPIRSYLEDVEAAGSLSDLLDVLYALYTDTGISVAFLTPYIDSDCTDATRNILWLDPDISSVDADTFSDEEVSEAFCEYCEKVLLLSGESQAEASKSAGDVLRYQKALAAVQTPPEHYYDAEYFYNFTSFADADKQLANIDLGAMLTAFGYSVPDSLAISDRGAFAYLCGFLCDENLDSLKSIMKVSVLNTYGSYLSNDFYQARLDFIKVLQGEVEPESPQGRARTLLLDSLSTEMGKLYVKKYFTQADKDRFSQIEQEYVKAFRERILSLDWMSLETKKQAVAKLEAMNFKNIWPDYWFTDQETKYLPSYNITSSAKGGSLFSNYAAVTRANTVMNIAKEGKPVDKAEWGSSPLEVNAFYSFFENGVYIMAGLLDNPIYKADASLETILGSIGSTIGHEMTHAFDNAGSKFDANGNAADWWTASDYAAFSERCNKMASLFNHFESAPGIMANGQITLGENVADLGGLTLSLEVAENLIKEPDYNAFFHGYSDSWRISYPRQTVSYYTAFEFHSMGWMRVNMPLMQTEQFYKTYGITEGDGMYLPLNERVEVW